MQDEPRRFIVLWELVSHRRLSWWLSIVVMASVLVAVLVRPDGVSPVGLGLGSIAATAVSAVLWSYSER